MRYVIDAYNLIHADDRLEEARDQRGFPAAKDLLVAMLSRFAHAEGLAEITAVFDGSEKAAHLPRSRREAAGKVLLLFADHKKNADHAIIEIVEDAKRPGEITVVTGDKFIIRHAQKAGAHHLGCRDFLRRVSRAVRHAADPLQGEHPGKFRGQLSEREIEEWAAWMGIS